MPRGAGSLGQDATQSLRKPEAQGHVRRARDALRVAAESSSLQKMQTSSRQRVIDGDSAMRKTFPMATGLLDYFPDACAEVARISYLGNEKHNPGEPMHHARGKSAEASTNK